MPTPAAYVKTLTPRVRQALRAYAVGNTQKVAAAYGGITKEYLSMLKNQNLLVQEELSRLNGELDERSIDVGVLMDRLSVRALGVMEEVMEQGSNDGLRLKAATAIADRGWRTSRVQRSASMALSIDGEDAQLLAAALVKAAEARAAYPEVSEGSHDLTVVAA